MVDVSEYTKKEVIRRCPYCYNEMRIKKGLTSENVKRLFRKPTVDDFIILFIVLLTIVSFLVYTYEIKAYKTYIDENCPLGQHNQQVKQDVYLPPLNTTEGLDNNINITNNETK
jgi:hypothetical protein